MNSPVDAEHNSYWDNRFSRTAVKLLPGDFFACTGEEMIVTVLGSCISVCLYETQLKIGGMNHFMLPETKNAPSKSVKRADENKCSYVYQDSNAARYGNVAMELLINEIIKLGGHRKNLTAKIFGGGSVTRSSIDIGEKNINYIKEYLALENITITNQDVGGTHPRKVYFVPKINDVYVKAIRNIHNNTIEQRETRYQKTLVQSANNVFYL